MSYILDALKRADAERARGAVPGLHTQPLTSSAPGGPASQRQTRWWLVSVVALVVITVLVYWRWQAVTTAPTVALPHRPVAAPLAVAPDVPVAPAVPTAPTATLPVPTVALPSPAPALVQETVTPKSSPVAVAPDSTSAKPVRPASAIAGTTRQAAVMPSAPVAAGKPAPVAASKPVAPREALAPMLSELPEDLRREIPPLNVTGSVYTADPRQRLLLVNNQVLPQGSQVVAGVTLLEIQPHSAVFSFQETRFRVRY